MSNCCKLPFWSRVAPVAAAMLCAVVLAGGAAAQTHTDLEDPDSGSKGDQKTAPAKTPTDPPGNKAKDNNTSPAKRPQPAPATSPTPANRAAPTPRPANRGITVAGRRYASTDHYLFGVWRWRNPQGHVILSTFAPNRGFVLNNTASGLRLYGRFRSVGSMIQFAFYRACQNQNCRNFAKPRRRQFPFVPQSANVMTSGNEVWRRISKD